MLNLAVFLLANLNVLPLGLRCFVSGLSPVAHRTKAGDVHKRRTFGDRIGFFKTTGLEAGDIRPLVNSVS